MLSSPLPPLTVGLRAISPCSECSMCVPMDLESHRRWYDFSRARDAMFAATDTPESPWYVIDSDDQRRGRLNCIAHFLSLIPYEEVKREKVKLPKRQSSDGYEEPNYPYRRVPEKY